MSCTRFKSTFQRPGLLFLALYLVLREKLFVWFWFIFDTKYAFYGKPFQKRVSNVKTAFNWKNMTCGRWCTTEMTAKSERKRSCNMQVANGNVARPVWNTKVNMYEPTLLVHNATSCVNRRSRLRFSFHKCWTLFRHCVGVFQRFDYKWSNCSPKRFSGHAGKSSTDWSYNFSRSKSLLDPHFDKGKDNPTPVQPLSGLSGRTKKERMNRSIACHCIHTTFNWQLIGTRD